MPTIEIISLGADKLGLDQKKYEVFILEQNKLESHRGLFYDFLKTQKGVIIHIGNPSIKDNKDEGYLAGLILDFEYVDPDYKESKAGLKSNAINHWANQQFKFKIQPQYFQDIIDILDVSINNSPIKTAYFLSDYQFGPEEPRIEGPFSIELFMKTHNIEGLKYNTLYEIRKT